MSDSLHNLRILLVDDDTSALRLLELLLHREGYQQVCSTHDARQALALFQSFKPDLILLDLKMPHFDGFEVIEHLRPLIPPDTFFPILVLTSDASAETKQRVLEMGANDFLTKPYDSCEVVLRIQNLLETRRLHLALRRRNEQLRIVSQELMEVQEAERRRIASELHDDIGQSLTALNINLHSAKSQSNPEELHVVLNESIDLAQSALQRARDLARALRPSMLDELGLVPALSSYLRAQSLRAGITAELISGDGAEAASCKLSTAAQMACFRVVQEAVTNVLRHANAGSIAITLEHDGNRLQLIVTDDGKGFEVDKAREKAMCGDSLGLLIMQERIALAGGEFEVCSPAPIGTGTQITIGFPVTMPDG